MLQLQQLSAACGRQPGAACWLSRTCPHLNSCKHWVRQASKGITAPGSPALDVWWPEVLACTPDLSPRTPPPWSH